MIRFEKNWRLFSNNLWCCFSLTWQKSHLYSCIVTIATAYCTITHFLTIKCRLVNDCRYQCIDAVWLWLSIWIAWFRAVIPHIESSLKLYGVRNWQSAPLVDMVQLTIVSWKVSGSFRVMWENSIPCGQNHQIPAWSHWHVRSLFICWTLPLQLSHQTNIFNHFNHEHLHWAPLKPTCRIKKLIKIKGSAAA